MRCHEMPQDVNFRWLQLGAFFSQQVTVEEAARKERIQKNTATLRVSFGQLGGANEWQMNVNDVKIHMKVHTEVS